MARSLEEGRLELHGKLCELLESNQVYFQPPETVKMKYPSIVYDLYRINQRFADDSNYHIMPGYSVTIIDWTNDLDWMNKMLSTFPYCSLERTYNADNLVHYSFILYYL
jgi:hypothetical protein